jgi:hypothetical protein
MWLTEHLVPDHKTIADFRKDNGRAIRQVCTAMGLFAEASVAIDGSKFNSRYPRRSNSRTLKGYASAGPRFRPLKLIRPRSIIRARQASDNP